MKRFLITFAAVALFLAGAASYLAEPSPDGLTTVLRQGCTVEESGVGTQLRGECMARTAEQHALAGGPLAGYTLLGEEGSTGIAGVVGVAATAVFAGGLFLLVRNRRHDHSRAG